jgi:hypothetical protein
MDPRKLHTRRFVYEGIEVRGQGSEVRDQGQGIRDKGRVAKDEGSTAERTKNKKTAKQR